MFYNVIASIQLDIFGRDQFVKKKKKKWIILLFSGHFRDPQILTFKT